MGKTKQTFDLILESLGTSWLGELNKRLYK